MSVGLQWNNAIAEADVFAVDGVLQAGDPLVTSSFISLFTRRRASTPEGGRLPTVPAGWWADSISSDPLGSRLWTLRGGKITENNLRLAQLYAQEALAWWLRDGVVKQFTVVVERGGTNRINIKLDATRPDGTRWSHVWEETLFDGL